MFSYWENEYYFENINYCIVGSGIVGLTTAIYLKKLRPSAIILMIDRGVLPKGASTKNAGFACIGSPTEILADLKNHSEEEVVGIIKQRWDGLANLKELVGEDKMNYKEYGGFELFKNEVSYNEVQNKLSYINQLYYEATGIKHWYGMKDNLYGFNTNFPLAFNKYEGQINPMSMLSNLHKKAIKLGVKILTSVTANHIDFNSKSIQTNVGHITANNIILCTNSFTKDLIPKIDITPVRNQVLITKPIQNLRIKGSFHFNEGYTYFRNYNNRILLGGARNIDFDNETTQEFGQSSIIKEALLNFLSTTILPNQTFEIEQWWSGIIGVGKQKTPIVRQYSEGVYVAARLSGIGVAIGSAVGKKMAQLVTS